MTRPRRSAPSAPLTLALALFAGAAAHFPARAQEQPAADRWSPAISMQYRAIQGTVISPNGERVAFVVREPLMEGEQSEYLSHIWVAAADGSGASQWTRGEKSAGSPAFSPDGAWLTFTTSRDGPGEHSERGQLWALRLTGGEAVQITDAESGVGSYRWSPDGTRIAFLMRDPDTPEEKKREKEKRDVILVDQEFDYSHLYVTEFRPDADELPAPIPLTAGELHITGLDWAPDGTRIAFSHQTDPRINTGRLNGDVSIVTVPSADEIAEIRAAHAGALGGEEEGGDPDQAAEAGMPEDHPRAAGTVTPLVTGAGVESSPRWSPDGRWVAFVSTGERIEPIGLGDLYVVAAEGGSPRRLAETPNRSVNILEWAADGRELYLGEVMGTKIGVIAVPLEGDAIRTVAASDGVLGSVSMTPGTDLMAFTWQTPDQPWDVYVSPTATFTPRRVTDLHAGVARPPMGRTELLTWRSPDDRFDIEGLLTYPIGYEEGRRYPLILNVHGGPAGVYTQSFTGGPSIYMLQYFAQEGFAILRPNPRGSTGYGKDFRYANFQDWGYGDLSDLLAGVDRVIEMGVAHADSLLLMGWSYGGYMTSFAVTQTDRFKAASMGAGLPNLVSMTTTTDIQDYLVGHMGVEFWEDYERYERHSAIYHIANVTTPTQVIHGANDLRVPFTQGQEFYRALDRLGVPTEMIVYPRTPHGPREPKFVMDVSERILTWFEKHLRKDTVTAATGDDG